MLIVANKSTCSIYNLQDLKHMFIVLSISVKKNFSNFLEEERAEVLAMAGEGEFCVASCFL